MKKYLKLINSKYDYYCSTQNIKLMVLGEIYEGYDADNMRYRIGKDLFFKWRFKDVTRYMKIKKLL